MQAIALISFYIKEEHKKLDAIFEKLEDKDLDYLIRPEEDMRTRIEHTIRSEVAMLRYLDEALDVAALEQPLDFSTVEKIKESARYSMEQHLKIIGSLRTRIKHTIRSEVAMLRYLDEALDVAALEQPLDFSTVEKIKESARYSMEQHLKIIGSLSDEDLNKTMTTPNGTEFAYHYVTYHMLQHLIEHRGQLAMKLRELQAEAST